VRAHEFAGVVGEWAWLGAAPMLGAAFAPFTRAWLRWLWLAAVAPLLYATWAWKYKDSAPGYPFFPSPEASHWGLWVSLVGAAVVLVALLSAFVLARRSPGARPAGWQPLAFAAAIPLVLLAAFVVRGPRDEGAERQVRMDLRRDSRAIDFERLRVECRDRLGRSLECGWELEEGGGSTEGGRWSSYEQ
jgi:hypothetical protein